MGTQIEPREAPPASAPALARTLGPLAVLFLTLSATTPASSVFVIVPGMLKAAGSGAMIAMLIAAIVCIATAFVYAELSAAWPHAGGEYVMVARTLGPLAGFVILGVNMINNLIFPAVVALGLSTVVARLIDGLQPVPVAVVVVIVSTLLSVLNLRVSAAVTALFLLVEFIALLVLVVLGLLHPINHLPTLLLHPQMPDHGALVPASFIGIGTATTIAIFALNGYGMAVYFGEDMHDPPRRIAKVVLLALVLTLAAEILPLAALLAASPDLLGTMLAGDPFGGFIDRAGGPMLGNLVSIGVGIAIVNAAIVSILAYARFLFATGRDAAWGRLLDGILQTIHPRFGSPWGATLLIGALSVGCCFVPLSLLLVMSGAGLLVTYAAISLAAIIRRRRWPAADSYRMPLFPVWPIITLLALVYIGWSNWLDVEEGRPGLVATAVQIVVSAAYYQFVLKRRGAWTVRDPA